MGSTPHAPFLGLEGLSCRYAGGSSSVETNNGKARGLAGRGFGAAEVGQLGAREAKAVRTVATVSANAWSARLTLPIKLMKPWMAPA